MEKGKAVAIIVIALVVINLGLLAVGVITRGTFWIVIGLAAVYSYMKKSRKLNP